MSLFNAIIYGEAGAGKTPFCATLEQCKATSPVLFLDVDQGAQFVDSSITVVPVTAWLDIQDIYKCLFGRKWDELNQCLQRFTGTAFPVKEYKSVVVDSGTELEYICRRQVITENSKGDFEVPDQSHYLRTQERMRRLYRAFRDLSMSFVMTAGVRELKDDIAGIIKHYPAFQPNLTKDLMRHADLIMFLGVKLEQDGKLMRVLQTQLTQRFVARDRSGRLPPFISAEKFYWKDIVAKINGDLPGV